MKKRFLMISAFALSLALAGCGTPSVSTPSSEGGNSDSAASSGAPISSSSSPTSSSSSSAPREPNQIIVAPPSYSEESIQIHYYRSDKAYAKWALWIWSPNKEGSEYAFNGEDSWNGAIASYPLTAFSLTAEGKLGFIVKKASADPLKPDWSAKDGYSADRYFSLSEFPADSKGVHHLYLKSGDGSEYYSDDYKIHDYIKETYFLTTSTLFFDVTNPVSAYELFKDGVSLLSQTLSTPKTTVYISLPTGTLVSFESVYEIKTTFVESKATLSKQVSIQNLFKSSAFSDAYTYSGDDLGVSYTSASSLFKVWSPFSSKVVLKIYATGTPLSLDSTNGSDTPTKTVEMLKGDKGVWSATLEGDFAGSYYTYTVTNSSYPNGQEIVDPYAKSCGINGLRGMIVDFSKTNPTGWDGVKVNAVDKKSLAVYETHLVDLTSSSTWSSSASDLSKAKTFEGAALSGTTYTKNGVTVKTGFDHVKELGNNAVELLPIFDQANDETHPSFNWGYNPLNYNCLEGSYSSNPYDGYARIKEFKDLVSAYTSAGINIIMDVVYNHVNGAKGSNFDVLCPGYYFRYESDGTPYNGSGCGNETASELPMMRKFIKESTAFWAKEYKLGGFRFDLMALHDLTTMKEVAANLKTINPTIAVYGEPWTGGTSGLAAKDQASQTNYAKWDGFGAFNDQMRDALIKGGMKDVTALGWATSSTSAAGADTRDPIKGGIRGYTFGTSVSCTDPNKTVNYASCHDNYTLYDRAYMAGIDDATSLHYMPLLANSLVLSSNGISFMLAGEEFLRTKNVRTETGEWKKDKGGRYVKDGNSYNASYEENALDYSYKIANADIFESYQKLVLFKTICGALHQEEDGVKNIAISVSESGNQFSYALHDSENKKDYLVVHNNGVAGTAGFPNADFSGYSLYLDTRNRSNFALSATTDFLPFETVVGVKDAA
jgi:pullulanase